MGSDVKEVAGSHLTNREKILLFSSFKPRVNIFTNHDSIIFIDWKLYQSYKIRTQGRRYNQTLEKIWV